MINNYVTLSNQLNCFKTYELRKAINITWNHNSNNEFKFGKIITSRMAIDLFCNTHTTYMYAIGHYYNVRNTSFKVFKC